MTLQDSILTTHNVLFTILTISLILPKAVLSYQGQSAVPTTLDLIYGLFITLSYFWLEAYRRHNPRRMSWYFEAPICSVVRNICKVVREYVVRKYKDHLIDIHLAAEEGRRRRNSTFASRPLLDRRQIVPLGDAQTTYVNTMSSGVEVASSQNLRRRNALERDAEAPVNNKRQSIHIDIPVTSPLHHLLHDTADEPPISLSPESPGEGLLIEASEFDAKPASMAASLISEISQLLMDQESSSQSDFLDLNLELGRLPGWVKIWPIQST